MLRHRRKQLGLVEIEVLTGLQLECASRFIRDRRKLKDGRRRPVEVFAFGCGAKLDAGLAGGNSESVGKVGRPGCHGIPVGTGVRVSLHNDFNWLNEQLDWIANAFRALFPQFSPRPSLLDRPWLRGAS